MPAKRPSRKAPGTLSTQVMHLLGRRIVSGEYPVGASLPVEPALCRTLRVSRTTLRDAVKKLNGKGLVAIGPKRGTVVRPQAEWMQLDPDVLGWRLRGRLDGDLLRQLYEVRATLEPEACRLAAINADDAARRAIAAAFEAMAAVHRDPPRVVEADVAFHMTIVDATRNVFLASLGAAIRGTLSFAFGLGVPIKPFSASELRGHRRVMEAILTRRPEAAARQMRRLLQESHRTLAAALGISKRTTPKTRTIHRRKPK